MQLFRTLKAVPSSVQGAVIAVGNFDGVHRGHAAVIGKARSLADKAGVPLAVLSFEPHPRRFFSPDQASFRLTPLRQRARVLADLGVDILFVPRFNRALAQTTAKSFVTDMLAGDLRARHIVVGRDFAFGRGRAGNIDTLLDLAAEAAIEVSCVAPVDDGGDAVSSTRIRDALGAGHPEQAALLLGRDWEIEGRVVHGEQRGRKLGFPTANIALGDILRPAFGVYAIRVTVDGAADSLPGVANLGRRPTFGGTKDLLEAHLFDFGGDLYGKRVRVALTAFLRPERKFDGLDALKAQIAEDAAQARRLAAPAKVSAD